MTLKERFMALLLYYPYNVWVRTSLHNSPFLLTLEHIYKIEDPNDTAMLLKDPAKMKEADIIQMLSTMSMPRHWLVEITSEGLTHHINGPRSALEFTPWLSLPHRTYQYLLMRKFNVPLWFGPGSEANNKTPVDLKLAMIDNEEYEATVPFVIDPFGRKNGNSFEQALETLKQEIVSTVGNEGSYETVTNHSMGCDNERHEILMVLERRGIKDMFIGHHTIGNVHQWIVSKKW